MQYFDLHCDTLYKAVTLKSSLNDNKNHISIDKGIVFDKWHQIFAIWIPDELRDENAKKLFLDCVDVFNNQNVNNERTKMSLAVENASMLCGDIQNTTLLFDANVKYVTLTWNAENELGGGSECQGVGLTTFGRDVVKELEKNNIAVDVSHSSDKLFYDVVNIATKPVVATHSNSRAITDVKRNLTDEQFKIIRDMGGIVGLNFFKGFLNNDENKASIEDILRHADHFLNLGGENTLAIGADFDGADMSRDISGLETVPAIYNRFLTEFGTNLTKKIFFDNANLYFSNFDNKRNTLYNKMLNYRKGDPNAI